VHAGLSSCDPIEQEIMGAVANEKEASHEQETL